MAKQVRGDFKVREENMKKYLQKVKDMISKVPNFDIQQVPQTENSKANLLSKLATLALGDLPWQSLFEILERSSIEDSAQVLQVDDELCWMDPFIAS